jgi:uncharacterized oxidoreductases, Fe-dependent alcohol dehydrogenase family
MVIPLCCVKIVFFPQKPLDRLLQPVFIIGSINRKLPSAMIVHSGEYRKKNGQRGCVMMNNFIFENKTKVSFGKGGVKEYLGGLLANFGETVMLAYGGGSIKRNGVYDEIMGILNAQGKCVVEFSGIMSNPTYAKVQDGAKLARASAMAENGVLKIGKVTDFQCHMQEHQLGAYTDCNHGAGLAVIHPVLYRHIYKSGTARFTRWAQNVWGIAPKGSDEETAAAGIDALAAFIKEIGLPTSFAELGIPADTDFRAVADSTNITAGCCKKLTRDEICEILQECL